MENAALTYGISAGRQRAAESGFSKWHPEVELLVPERRHATLMIGGRRVELRFGQLTVFWAATPHLFIGSDRRTILNWLTIPLPTVMQWQLPGGLLRSLLHRDILFDPQKPASADISNMTRWREDLLSDQPARIQAALLEAQARLYRLSLECSFNSLDISGISEEYVERMAVYISEHFSRPLTVSDVARRVHLHPRYATTVFRQIVGIPLQEYLIRYRLAHARQLLLATDIPIGSVSERSGFKTPGCFYAMFRARIGCTPATYRLRVRAGRACQRPGPIAGRYE
jgi:AraC-like DNA-binding protein